ncbi:MAG: response regulator [FCB group bacterium]|jgi:PAS domain S-box-containing protein|nr:response regulator [FCB group bacterium]
MSQSPFESVGNAHGFCPASTMRILVVEDDPEALDLYRRCLGRLRTRSNGSHRNHSRFTPAVSFELTTCVQGEEAVEAVRTAMAEGKPYAVLFQDLRLPPGRDGLWSAGQIRALDPHVNIVLVTGFGVDPARIGRQIPPVDKLYYIEKPFQPQEIVQFAIALSSKWQLEGRLHEAYHELEARVDQRTAELERVNEELKQDIEERHRVELTLRESESRLRRQYRALMDLTHAKARTAGNLPAALREVTEAAARTLDVARVSVWLYEADGRAARCHDLYLRAEDTHCEGEIMLVKDYPQYFRALEESRALAAHDALTDRRLRELRDTCLGPAQIRASLDAPIRVGGRTVGVVRHDHSGRARQWNLDEQSFAGSVADFVALVLEACERKRREEHLRRLMRAVEQSNDGIVVMDLECRVQFVNSAFAEMHGFVECDLTNEHLSLFHTPEQFKTEVQPMLAQVIESGSCQTRSGHLKQDGTILPTWMTVTLLKDEADEPMGMLAITRDISDHLRSEERGAHLEEQLRRSQKMEAIGRLAGGVAHDFNNMLMAIIGCSEILLASLPEDEPLRREVEEIRKAGERAGELTRQLLVFSRRQVLQPKVIDLNGVVGDINKMLQRVIGEDIELVTVLHPHLGRVKADPGQLEQVIINLAINARDAMPQGGRLTIETLNVDLDETYVRDHAMVKPGHYVMLAVSDTGTGMDAETQAHIFEPFFTTKEQDKGTGLGLATVYGTIQQSGGSIYVYSEVNRGTTFKIYLPRVTTSAHRAALPPVKQPEVQGTETVLLVEDDPVVRELVQRTLARYGYTVLQAASGNEALNICQEHEDTIHVMLTDVVMPQMSGRELAQAVNECRPEIKVLFMSGYSGEAVVRHGILGQEMPFLQKPFTPDALTRKIRQALSHSHRRRS